MAYKILVVDDTSVIREFLKEVLTDMGFEVELAENGQIGYDMLLAGNYTLIFSDVHMPVMNGEEMVRKIKQLKPEIPIIMTDSYPDKLALKATNAGAICCLAKPFDLNELRKIINRIIKPREISAK
jgi:two-component system response regulator (stage 0 sporulation protein F)